MSNTITWEPVVSPNEEVSTVEMMKVNGHPVRILEKLVQTEMYNLFDLTATTPTVLGSSLDYDYIKSLAEEGYQQ